MHQKSLKALFHTPLQLIPFSVTPFSVTPFSFLNRWLGDYGGQRQKFFPANYCEEINYVAEEEAKNNKYENGVDEESEAPVS